jgi:hypothetical protein
MTLMTRSDAVGAAALQMKMERKVSNFFAGKEWKYGNKNKILQNGNENENVLAEMEQPFSAEQCGNRISFSS